jgi:hypothetical protein
MQSEIGWWKEADVESKVKDFYIKKVAPVAPTPSTLPTQEPNTTPQPLQPEAFLTQEKVNMVRNKITQANLPTPA